MVSKGSFAEETSSAQEWTNRTLISHERTSVHFLVLPVPGSLFSFTEITEYTYISLIQTLAEFKYKTD